MLTNAMMAGRSAFEMMIDKIYKEMSKIKFLQAKTWSSGQKKLIRNEKSIEKM